MRAKHNPQSPILFDYLGRKLASSGYISSGSSRRSMRGWNPSALSADADTIPKLEEMRASSRDLIMNSPIAAAAVDKYKTHVVGYGLTLQARIDSKFLKLTAEQAEEWEQNVEREFRIWAENNDCDAERTCDFYQLQTLSYISKLSSGDVFYLPMSIPRPGSVYDLRIKILEADMVSNPLGKIDDETIAGGVEVDTDGAPVAYHISKRHPGGLGFFNNDWVRIEAFAKRTGFRQVFHIYDKLRPGQRRGVPLLAPVIETLKQATRLSEAELMAAVVSSFFTVFVKTSSGSTDILGNGISTDRQVSKPNENDDDKNVYEMGPGNIISLADEEEVQIADAKRPNAAYDPFFSSMMKQVGTAIGMPYEVLISHFESSYSAARAALLEAYKSCNMHRVVNVERQFCKPIYRMWLLESVLKRRIEAPGFIDSIATREAWSGSRWLGQGQGQINPVVETKAAVMRIQSRLSTYSKETALIDGDDWDSMSDRGAREERLVTEKYGAPTVVDGTKDKDLKDQEDKEDQEDNSDNSQEDK